MNNVSWGTRDVTIVRKPKNEKVDKKKKEEAEKKKKEEALKPPKDQVYSFFGNNTDNAGSIEFSLGGLFKLLCFTYQKDAKEEEMLKNIQASIEKLQAKLDYIEHKRLYPDYPEPRKMEKADTSRMKEGGPKLSDEDDTEDKDSIVSPTDDIPGNIWFYEGDLEKSSVDYLDRKEENFWTKFIKLYLEPLDDTDKKEEVAKNLKDLRDKMVVTFFMLNCMFVLIIFLLNMQQEVIHLDWPINPKINFTYITDQNEIIINKTYLQLQPIGFVFLLCFALVMIIQFFAMFVHRFGTFSQIMANTVTNLNPFASENVNDLTEEKILEQDSIKIIKKLFKLQGINDDKNGEAESPVGKRNTAHFLAMKKDKKPKPPIEDLEKAFLTRLERYRNGGKTENNLNIPRHTQAALFFRVDQVHRRQTELGIRTPRS